MHANLHLPKKSKKKRFSSQTKREPWWNCFKEINLNYQGTANIPFQFAANISAKNHIKNYLTKEFSNFQRTLSETTWKKTFKS